jgi:hypothetical protein
MTVSRRILARVVWSSLFWMAADRTLSACPICFQMEGGPVVDGVRAAVIVLVAITGSVLVGFAAFATRLARQENLGTPEPRNPGTPD